MSIAPLITFKAGECDIDTTSTPYKVTPKSEPGYAYVYSDGELTHFCWRERNTSLQDPSIDLVIVPTDATFVPYESDTTARPTAKTNGRIFVLKFSSSSQRYLFWLQSKPQGSEGDSAYLSPRDRKIGDVVNRLLQGEEVEVKEEMQEVGNVDNRREDDDDHPMEDVGRSGAQDRHGSGSGGAGPDATGGDVREEGEDSREGGADGARAGASSDSDAAAAVRNLLASLNGQPGMGSGQGRPDADIPYPFLTHLLPTSTTVPMIDTASEEYINGLLNFLPPAVIVLASSSESFDTKTEPTPDALEAAKASLSLEDRRSLLKRVARSPQFHQALTSLTMALRDGGLPGIADALGVKVENGGYLQGSQMSLGGGRALKAFVDGVKQTAQEKKA